MKPTVHIFSLTLGDTRQMVKAPTKKEAFDLIMMRRGWYTQSIDPNLVRQLDEDKRATIILS